MDRRQLAIAFLVLIVCGAIGVAIYLWRQNEELRSRLEAAAAEEPANPAPTIRRVREGDELPEFSARNSDGRDVKVAERGRRTSLLLIYSPTCDRCEAGIPAWARLIKKLEELKAPVAIVPLSVADSYETVLHARDHKLPFAPVPFPDAELQRRYGVTEVPLTVVVDGQGRVQAVWAHPLEEGEVGDVVETVCPECIEQATTTVQTSMPEEERR